MSRGASPFAPRTILVVLTLGAGSFLLFLYAVGAGWDGRGDRDGGAHAAANGLNGFAGLVRLLEARGHEVSLSRSEARLTDEALLVLTPQVAADGERVAEIVAARRHLGPTLVILPKWMAIETSQLRSIEAPQGWVVLTQAVAPDWLDEIDGLAESEAEVVERKRWEGMGLVGRTADPKRVLALSAPSLLPLVTDERGDVLAGYVQDAGTYPVLDAAAQLPLRDATDPAVDPDLWALVVVAEPDLVNNYGLADRGRAELALAIVEASRESEDLPIVFDLTAAGLGRSENLLTLAFTPPFLAATLILLLAAAIVGWRGFFRFGAPVAEAPSLAKGKRQLARNGAALIERARRLHLLGPPYAALVTARIAETLGVRGGDPQAREAAVAHILAVRGVSADFAAQAEALRGARRPAELLRAADALRTVERTLTR